MKKFRKVIPAFILLLVATALMSTATFAWFSMNTTVQATNMQVTAKTDNAYLVIKSGTENFDGTERSITVTSELDTQLYPVKPLSALTASTVGTITNWGTAQSSNPNDANSSASLTALPENTTFSNYIAKQSFMVGIVPDSGAPANDLRLDSLTISNANAGITVVVVCGTNIYTSATNITNGANVLAAASAVTTTGVQVDVYIYIDGSNSNVYTSNAANLTGTVALAFSIEALQ